MDDTRNANRPLLVGDRVQYRGQWQTVIDIDNSKGVRLGGSWIRRDSLEPVDSTGRWRYVGNVR